MSLNDRLLRDLDFAMARAEKRHGQLPCAMTGLGVVSEEYYEVVHAFRSGEHHRMRAELVDLANAANRCIVALDAGEWT